MGGEIAALLRQLDNVGKKIESLRTQFQEIKTVVKYRPDKGVTASVFGNYNINTNTNTVDTFVSGVKITENVPKNPVTNKNIPMFQNKHFSSLPSNSRLFSSKIEECDVDFKTQYVEPYMGNKVNLDWQLKNFGIKEEAKKVLEDCKNLTLDSPNLKLMKDKYDENNIYDLGLRFAVIANNTVKARKNALIINEVPEMFKGLDKNNLMYTLDELSTRLDNKKINNFIIDGKKFKAEVIGGGELSIVYKITDEKGNEIVYKCADNPYILGGGHAEHGIYSEVALLQEANKAKVADVPKLYMTNPVGYYVQHPDEGWMQHKGAWQIIEYIKDDRKVPENSLKLVDWLESKGLICGDNHSGNYIGDIRIDFGGIVDKKETLFSLNSDSTDFGWLLKAYYNGITTDEILKKINDLKQ